MLEHNLMSENLWFVYMILSSDRQIYTGITTDMARRWREHDSGKAGARYFSGRKPEFLCLLEAGHSRSSSAQREYAIKSLNRQQKNLLIEHSINNTLETIKSCGITQLPVIDSHLHLLGKA
jgi:putative endonuclease